MTNKAGPVNPLLLALFALLRIQPLNLRGPFATCLIPRLHPFLPHHCPSARLWAFKLGFLALGLTTGKRGILHLGVPIPSDSDTHGVRVRP